MSELKSVRVEEPQSMHLFGLMLSLILEKNLGRARYLKFGLPAVSLEVDGMELTLSVDGDQVVIRKGSDPGSAARLNATMQALLNAALKYDVVRPVVTGNLKIRGNPIALGKWLPLMLS